MLASHFNSVRFVLSIAWNGTRVVEDKEVFPLWVTRCVASRQDWGNCLLLAPSPIDVLELHSMSGFPISVQDWDVVWELDTATELDVC